MGWFTQLQIDGDAISYHHDGSETLGDMIGFALTDTHNCCVNAAGKGCSDTAIESCVCSVDDYCCNTRWDGVCVTAVTGTCGAACGASGGNVDFSISVNPINDPPVLVTNNPLAVPTGLAAPITTSHLAVADADNTPGQLVYNVTAPPGHGELRLVSTPTGSFTQADIQSGAVNYLHDGSGLGSDSFVFFITDGIGGSVGPYTFHIKAGEVIFDNGFEEVE